MAVIDASKALELLTEAVAERGEDYAYPRDVSKKRSCRYWHEEEQAPGCGVGLVLYRLGVPAEVLQAYDNATSHFTFLGTGQPGAREVAPLYGFTPAAAQVLEAFQLRQDRGRTWGQALECARGVALKLGAGGEGLLTRLRMEFGP